MRNISDIKMYYPRITYAHVEKDYMIEHVAKQIFKDFNIIKYRSYGPENNVAILLQIAMFLGHKMIKYDHSITSISRKEQADVEVAHIAKHLKFFMDSVPGFTDVKIAVKLNERWIAGL